MKISICIPYHQTPKTAFFLSRLLKSIEAQTFKEYEIILTSEGPFARNHNAAIMKATGVIVQMMQMDDYFSDSDSLHRIHDSFTPTTTWTISACLHSVGEVVGAYHAPE